MKPGKTFSESWHRIANLRVSLRPTVKVRRQFFRGEKWYVLHDPFNNSFFRLRPEAYEFISRLRPDRTVEEVWEDCLNRRPDDAPGQEDVQQLLTQLYYSNLLYSETPADSAKLFERYKERIKREVSSWFLNIMFVQIPLIDPENFLKKFLALIKIIIGPLGAIVWLAVVGAASKCVFDRFGLVTEMAQGILAPDNLFLLYVGLVFIKSFHEFGHAMVCKRYGGEVHTMGIMMLIFTPLPFMDASSAWAFRSRAQRVFVGAAGMIIEFFVAGLAVFVWAYTGKGTLHSLAYNIMFIASVSTVLFNGNFLLHFDGYYILADLMDIPNLAPRSFQQLRHLAEKYLLGYKDSFSPAQNPKEAFWLCLYGISSGIFHLFVFAHIILFVMDKFLLAGVIIALVCIIAWGIVPFYHLIEYLASSPRLAKSRPRAIAVCISIAATVIFFLAIFPFPKRFRSPGVLEAVDYIRVVNKAPGYVETLFTPSGTKVKKGTPLLELSDHELEIEIKSTEAQKEETLALQMRAMSQEVADLKPIKKRLEVIDSRLEDLEKQRQDLIVKARQPGVWVAPQAKEMIGTWASKGTVMGEIVAQGNFRFSTVVSQDDAANLFVDQITKAEVRLFGHAGTNIDVEDYKIIPFQQEKLPSAALGWFGGGEVAVSPTDKTGLQASEPFFQIYAALRPSPEATFLQGRSGKLRFSMHPEPLLIQWARSFRRLLQKRYQI